MHDMNVRNAMRKYSADPSDANAHSLASLILRSQGAPEGEEEAPENTPEQEYWSDVRGVGEDCQRALADREIADREGLLDWLNETVDGHSRVIYTHAAKECLAHTRNADAYVDNFGTEGVTRNGDMNWSALAYAAFEADIMEWLDAHGTDVNNPFSCQECSETWESADEATECCQGEEDDA